MEEIKGLKDKVTEAEKAKTAVDTQLKTAQDELAKHNPEEAKNYYDSQIKIHDEDWQKKIEAVTKDRDKYKESHEKYLLNDAIAKGTSDLQFMDGLKDGFVAVVLARNEFKPQEIDGETKFLNKEGYEIKDVMHSFALSNDGKAYIKNSAGGGGAGSVQGGANKTAGMKNPFKKESKNLTEQGRLYREDRAMYDRLKAEAEA